MAKQKIKMEVGKRYKGYGLLNEYGEYTFEPCQVETNPQNMKKVIEREDGTTIYESKDFFKISMKVRKNSDYQAVLRAFTIGLTRAVYELRNYIE